MILNELLYDPEYEPDMFEYELSQERDILEKDNYKYVFVITIKINSYYGDDLISSSISIEIYANYDSAIKRKNELEQIADETDSMESITFVDIIKKEVRL